MPSEPAIRRMQDGDLGAIEQLLRAEWPDVDWPSRFRRQWRDNPAWTPAGTRGFVHEHDRRLLGFFGSIPMRYQLDGQPASACAATALCVRAAARGRGIARALVAAFDAQDVALRINATPNATTAAMFTGIGYTSVDPSAGRRLFAHARQPLGALRKAWRARARGFLRTLAAELRRRRPAGEPALAGAPLPAATEELDALWERHRAAHPTTLWRDRATLQWLVFADPRNTVLGCRDPAGRLRGYAAFRPVAGELRQLDLFPAHDADVAVALALAGVARADALGCAVVRLLPVTGAAEAPLVDHGFEPVADDLTLALLQRGAGPGGSWFTRIDGDRWL